MNIETMTPKQRVFETLRNLHAVVCKTEDLNDIRAKLRVALERCVSWESELMSVDDHKK